MKISIIAEKNWHDPGYLIIYFFCNVATFIYCMIHQRKQRKFLKICIMLKNIISSFNNSIKKHL